MEQATSEQLRQEAAAATARAEELAVRRTTIDQDLVRVREDLHRARMDAAKAGEPVGQAGADLRLELEGLEDERASLPEEHWGAQVRSAELHLQSHARRADELAGPIADADAAQAQAEGDEAAAIARAEEARRVAGRLHRSRTIARERGEEYGELLARVEREGVNPLPMV